MTVTLLDADHLLWRWCHGELENREAKLATMREEAATTAASIGEEGGDREAKLAMAREEEEETRRRRIGEGEGD